MILHLLTELEQVKEDIRGISAKMENIVGNPAGSLTSIGERLETAETWEALTLIDREAGESNSNTKKMLVRNISIS